MITFKYGAGGSLTCDKEIIGHTGLLMDDTAVSYGNKYMIAESMNLLTAIFIAEMYGKKLNTNYKLIKENGDFISSGGR